MSAEPALDPAIHAPVRLRVMASLVAGPAGTLIAFTRLRDLLAVTDGNLGSHVAALEGAGYVQVVKDFHLKRPRTRLAATPLGRRAYAGHVEALRAILDGTALEPDASETGEGTAR